MQPHTRIPAQMDTSCEYFDWDSLLDGNPATRTVLSKTRRRIDDNGNECRMYVACVAHRERDENGRVALAREEQREKGNGSIESGKKETEKTSTRDGTHVTEKGMKGTLSTDK